MMIDRRRKNQGVTVKASFVLGDSGPEASTKNYNNSWETPEDMKDRQLYQRLCEYGQRGGCRKCEVGCKFGEAFLARGLDKKDAAKMKGVNRKMKLKLAFPAIAERMEKLEMGLVDLSHETGMSYEMLKIRLTGKKSLTLEEAISIKKALGMEENLEEVFKRAA